MLKSKQEVEESFLQKFWWKFNADTITNKFSAEECQQMLDFFHSIRLSDEQEYKRGVVDKVLEIYDDGFSHLHGGGNGRMLVIQIRDKIAKLK